MMEWNVLMDLPRVTKIERPPEVLIGGSEDYVLYDKFELHDKNGKRRRGYLEEAWTFNGIDRGDIVEMDTYIYDGGIRPIVLDDEHKEVTAHFKGWEKWPIGPGDLGTEIEQGIHIHIVCRVNGKNETLSDDAIKVHRNGNRLTARPHWGVYLVWGKSQ